MQSGQAVRPSSRSTGAIIEYEGSRLPIVMAGVLWLFFAFAALRSAVARNFVAHRAFMIRSYALALTLVWLRVMYDFQDYLFFFVQDEQMRDVTREWASWAAPLFVVEFWISWLPQVWPKNPLKQTNGHGVD